MNENILKNLQEWFVKYAKKYLTNDDTFNSAIQLKIDHTERVGKEISMLCDELSLCQQETLLAKTMALLHDIGRFQQFRKYQTFSDLKSENHAKLGIQQIVANKLLSDIEPFEKKLILKAVAYHNVKTLPKHQNDKTVFFTRLLRDADKLDIWQIMIDYYNSKKTEYNRFISHNLNDDDLYSSDVIKSFQTHTPVSLEHLTTLNDCKLLHISWVFDLNFLPSFKAVHDRQYINKISKKLPKTKEIHDAIKIATEYVNSFL